MNTFSLRTAALSAALVLSGACGDGNTDDNTNSFTPNGNGPVVTDTGDGGVDENDSIEAAEVYGDDSTDSVTGVTGVSGKISPAGDRDFYSYAMMADQPYHIYTRAYFNDEPTDTVIRLWDAAGNLITENDDMIYRFAETDSGVWYQPAADETVYIEVLEFSDWANETQGGSYDLAGGASYDYELYVLPAAILEYDKGNNSISEVQALDAENFPEQGQGVSQLHATFDSHYWGLIDQKGDVDYYEFDYTADDDPTTPDEPYFFLTISSWPMTGNDTTGMSYTLVNEAGETVARTDQPVPEDDAFFFISDVGMMAYVALGQKYYLKVEGAPKGANGASSFYPLTSVTYLPSLAEYEVEGGIGNDTVETSASLAFEESTTSPGRYFASYWGTVISETDVDVYKMDYKNIGNSWAGRYTTIRVAAGDYGSLLDATLEVIGTDGTVLATVEADEERKGSTDPWLRDFQVPDGNTDVYLRVTANKRGDIDLTNNYMLQIISGLEPIYDEE